MLAILLELAYLLPRFCIKEITVLDVVPSKLEFQFQPSDHINNFQGNSSKMKAEGKSLVSNVNAALRNSNNGSAPTPKLVQVTAVNGKLEVTKSAIGGFGGSFLIRNDSDEAVFFKTRTNASKLFQVLPVMGYLDSNRTVTVTVRAPGNDSPSLDGKERFQVQAFKIPADYFKKVSSAGLSLQVLGQLWKEISNQVNVESHHLGVTVRSDLDVETEIDSSVCSLETSAALSDTEYSRLKAVVETYFQENSTKTLQMKEDKIKSHGKDNERLPKSSEKGPKNDNAAFSTRFALVRSKHRVQLMKGVSMPSSPAFYGCFNCPVDFAQQTLPVCLSLFCNQNMQFALHVCFPKQHSDSDLHIGCCLIQIRFLNISHQPIQAHSFEFDAKQGTCTMLPGLHMNSSPLHIPTFASKFLTSWNDLQVGNCLAKGINCSPTSGAKSLLYEYINVDTEVVFLKNTGDCNLDKAVFPSSFSSKLCKLINASSDPEPCFNYRAIIKCGSDRKDVFIFFRQLLKEYSPVIELLGKEIEIARTDNPVEVEAPYVSKGAMVLFYEYVHGRDCGSWLNSSCRLEDAMAMVQTGRKLNLKCLEERGIRWMDKKKLEDQAGDAGIIAKKLYN
ncbi:unnamed protein product [Allacma fusca]|uniref:MSP domain-containing protein n=1 Tax=Allacma fusca TaxID=39272 RepID=A0A8J2PIQ7_9HEXA|nr:unnamed protein product [Allacma fusca]